MGASARTPPVGRNSTGISCRIPGTKPGRSPRPQPCASLSCHLPQALSPAVTGHLINPQGKRGLAQAGLWSLNEVSKRFCCFAPTAVPRVNILNQHNPFHSQCLAAALPSAPPRLLEDHTGTWSLQVTSDSMSKGGRETTGSSFPDSQESEELNTQHC